ncbi:activator-dependent family glycosyltransferase [Streptomyces sp. NPDC005955]|uniref:activator-dependent family glycosyltransferase n=1 Tax=Streptomyces sp. NPDC005955 TaxID=3364738 RepID=UPI00369E8E35
MRVIFASFALKTHFFSQVPLAWALRSSGHEVRVASQPSLTEAITAAGLTAVAVGTDHSWRETMSGASAPHSDWDAGLDLDPTRPGVHHWEVLRGVNAQLTERFFASANNDSMVDDLVRFARGWRPDLVIWEPFTPAGAIAAEASGSAHARLLWGADLFVDQRREYLRERLLQPAEQRKDPLAEWMSGKAEKYGLSFDERLLRGHWTIDQMPASIRLPLGERTLPMRYIPYNGHSVVPPWLRETPTRPRVCVTFGTTAREGTGDGAESLTRILEGLDGLDVEVIATLDAAQLGTMSKVPDNVKPFDFVPLTVLLPGCSAIVHHGGAGTWSTAVAAGVPQLIVPSEWDDYYRARRTAELGAGLVVAHDGLDAAAVRAGVQRLIAEPRFSDGAERLRGEMAADPAPGDLVHTLEKWTLEQLESGY